MNIQQIEYVLAVAELKHFEQAAERCFVTQSTLSTMVSRLEKEIGIQIFDRKKKPVTITKEGWQLIEQMQIVSREIEQLNEQVKSIKGEIRGNLTISVIPTIAPFLLPLFLQDFAEKFPELKIEVREETTKEIVRQLKARELDIGIISIPVMDKELKEVSLYDERFVYYDTASSRSEQLLSEKLDRSKLCLLEEGHCMRTQIINLCDMNDQLLTNKLNFEYKAGSIDSLIRFVNSNGAATLLPYLSTLSLRNEEKKHLMEFLPPLPYRTVGLAVHRHFVKHRVLEELKSEILRKVSPLLADVEISGEQLSPI